MPPNWYDLRVFTRDGEGGNPLGVVPDPTGASDEDLQRGAAGIGYSETVYVTGWVADDGAEIPRARMFTPTTELEFAGHPLVGMAWLLEHLGPRKGIPAIEAGVGRMPCGADAGGAWIECDPVPFGRADDPSLALDALGLPAVSGPCRLVGVGQPYLMAQALSAEAISSLRPDFDRLRETSYGRGACVWALESQERARMRFFAPGLGVDEDPATGSAAVALGLVLAWLRLLPQDRPLEVLQGDELAKPSRLLVSATPAGAIRLEGTVTLDGVRQMKG